MSKIAKVHPFELTINQKSDSNDDSKDLDMSSPLLLQSFYYKNTQTNSFLKQIDRLNQSFSSYSDKYLNLKSEIDKVSDSLFINLFKQISLYVEEIERLNLKLKEQEKERRKRSKHKTKHSNPKDSKELQTCKNTIKSLEHKLSEKIQNEDKLKKELLSFKRQITFYQDKLQLNYLQRDSNGNGNGSHNKRNNKQLCSSMTLNFKSKLSSADTASSFQRISSLKNNDNLSSNTTRNNTLLIGSFVQGGFSALSKRIQTEQNETLNKSGYKDNNVNTSISRATHCSQSKSNIKCKTERGKVRLNRSMNESNTIASIEHIDKEQVESIAQDYNDIINQELVLLNKEENLLEDIIVNYDKYKNNNKK